VNSGSSFVTVGEVKKYIGKLKRHKAAYLDNISSEHLIFGGPQLVVHLTLLFNSMMHHCFVPSAFCHGVILPLLKNKHGDATILTCIVVLLYHQLYLRYLSQFC